MVYKASQAVSSRMIADWSKSGHCVLLPIISRALETSVHGQRQGCDSNCIKPDILTDPGQLRRTWLIRPTARLQRAHRKHYSSFSRRETPMQQDQFKQKLSPIMSKLKKNLTCLWQKRRRKLGGRSPRCTALPHGPLHQQAQSLLFSRLPPELRLHIYTAALIVSNRFMHILHQIPDQGELARLGHWQCDDAGNYHMVWQHRCFGPYVETYEQIFYMDMKHTSNTKSLSLLLSCRVM